MTVTLEKRSVMLSFWVKTVARSDKMLVNNQQRKSKQTGARQDTSCQLYQTLLGESTAWPWVRDTRETECDAIILSENSGNISWYAVLCQITVSIGSVNKRESGRTRHVDYTKHCYAKVRHDRDTRETECDAIILSENSGKSSWFARQQSAEDK